MKDNPKENPQLDPDNLATAEEHGHLFNLARTMLAHTGDCPYNEVTEACCILLGFIHSQIEGDVPIEEFADEIYKSLVVNRRLRELEEVSGGAKH